MSKGKYYVNEPFSMSGRSTICKGSETISLHNAVMKLNQFEDALQKVLDDSEIGIVPRSHLDRIKKILKQPAA